MTRSWMVSLCRIISKPWSKQSFKQNIFIIHSFTCRIFHILNKRLIIFSPIQNQICFLTKRNQIFDTGKRDNYVHACVTEGRWTMVDAIIILPCIVHKEAHRQGCRVILGICNEKATIFFIRDKMVHALDDCFTQYYSILPFITEQITATSGNMSSFPSLGRLQPTFMSQKQTGFPPVISHRWLEVPNLAFDRRTWEWKGFCLSKSYQPQISSLQLGKLIQCQVWNFCFFAACVNPVFFRRYNRLYAFNLVVACKYAGVPLISGRLTAQTVCDA